MSTLPLSSILLLPLPDFCPLVGDSTPGSQPGAEFQILNLRTISTSFVLVCPTEDNGEHDNDCGKDVKDGKGDPYLGSF